jgi:hypothetical protein
MTANKELGKLIVLNGPSFSGKTHLNTELTSILSEEYNVSNVSFEMVYKQDDTYAQMLCNFAELVYQKRRTYDMVLAESTVVQFGTNILHIICLPSFEWHIKYFLHWEKEFGTYDAIKRLGSFNPNDSIEKNLKTIRDNFLINYKFTSDRIFIASNGFNLYLLDAVRHYARVDDYMIH